jgi:hypothetical protein
VTKVIVHNNNNTKDLSLWNMQFRTKAEKFIGYTNKYYYNTNKGLKLNPGGIYTGIWCRDASYVLRDWFISGRVYEALEQLYIIWSYQIRPDSNYKIVYGRGSPEMDFRPVIASHKTTKKFEGALPTSIFKENNVVEIFGKNPDIDSTALMIYAASWILFKLLEKKENANSNSESLLDLNEKTSLLYLHNRTKTRTIKTSKLYPLTDKVLNFVIPKMEKATAYLAKRDIDNDCLLEQDHNEDWMDSIMRIGKIVYSNASWILALKNFSKLLKRLDNLSHSSSRRSEKYHYDKAAKIPSYKIEKLANKVTQAVEQKLWSEEDGSYIDIQQEEQHIGGPYRTLTQDVVLYLIAFTEEQVEKEYERQRRNKGRQQQYDTLATNNSSGDDNNNNDSSYNRGLSTLAAIRTRTWKKNKWPLVTEVELERTGPWILKPYQYHNYTFWPWITALEILARSRFGQLNECNILFSNLASSDEPHIHTFYEWVNPKTDRGEGAYPFRTGISAVRIAIFDILKSMKSENNNNE